jgi:hypothetical protein
MGQNECRVQLFLSFVHHFLLWGGALVSKQQLKDCLEVISEYNPWFPEEGTLDEEVWEQARKNVEKAYRQGEKIPIHFWITWALVKSVILILRGERREENLEKDTVASFHECELDTGNMEKITKESKRCFSHGFTVPEETECKPRHSALAIVSTPLRETADFFPSPRGGGLEWTSWKGKHWRGNELFTYSPWQGLWKK